MLKLSYFSVSVLIILNVQGFAANSQDNESAMMELIPETNSTLPSIHDEQQSVDLKLPAAQSTVEAQRITVQNSSQDVTTKKDFAAGLRETEEKLMAGISELKNQLNFLQTNLESQQNPLMEFLQGTIRRDDFEVRLNVTEEQLLASNSELKTQLKEMHTNMRDQETERQTKLDAQLLAVQEKLEDQNTLLESLEARQKGAEGQLRMFETKMEAQLKELQNKNENQLSAFQKTLLESHSTIKSKTIDPRFELIGSRYFYIEHDIRKSWDRAATTCRGMGGYLANFKSQEELAAVMQKLKIGYWCWTGINDLKEEGKFISTASGKPATAFKWAEGEPNSNGDCVYIHMGTGGGVMGDYDCSSESNFICQSDNET